MNTNENPVTLIIVSRQQRHGGKLLLQAKRFNELGVRGGVFTLQVLEQTATLCHLFDQTAAGTEVLAVCFQVLCQFLDLSR